MNLIRRDRRDAPAPQRRSQEWNPFRMMDELFRWDPYGTLERWSGGTDFLPSFDVKETKEAYVVEADLPGVKEENVEISLTGNVLQIAGRREDETKEEGDQWFVVERSHGQFNRSFSLPEGADGEQVKAEMKNGVLHIQIPKKPEVQPRRINIGVRSTSRAKS
ncbi:MAG TPA: HSP20 family small heat-shock protein [Polyangia bacterium]|nr:HSP20 family small heat-shock protein [Polyangia bacterium]